MVAMKSDVSQSDRIGDEVLLVPGLPLLISILVERSLRE